MYKKYIFPILNIATLCIIIFVVSIFFIYKSETIGFVLIVLSFLCLIPLFFSKTRIKSIIPDIIFGIIDNGVLVIFSVFGGEIAGVAGAVIGGAVGNAITDGIAGMFEGYSAEKLRLENVEEERTILGSAIGKMAGCLLGAGVVLTAVGFF